MTRILAIPTLLLSTVFALGLMTFVATAAVVDSDGDGVNDYREGKDGTDPDNASSVNPLSKGLVAHYPFNGNANDESGNGNNATGKNVSYSLDILADTSRSIVNLGQISSIITPVFTRNKPASGSISCSLQYNGKSRPNGVGSPIWNASWFANDFALVLRNGEPVIWAKEFSKVNSIPNYVDPESIGFSKLNNQTYVNLVVTWSPDGTKAYENGLLVGQSSNPFRTESIEPLKIGNEFYSITSEDYFAGKVDEVRIYNRALSDDEVLALYNAERPVYEVTLTLKSSTNMTDWIPVLTNIVETYNPQEFYKNDISVRIKTP